MNYSNANNNKAGDITIESVEATLSKFYDHRARARLEALWEFFGHETTRVNVGEELFAEIALVLTGSVPENGILNLGYAHIKFIIECNPFIPVDARTAFCIGPSEVFGHQFEDIKRVAVFKEKQESGELNGTVVVDEETK